MTPTPKESLDFIKKFLEMYQEDLLKPKLNRSAGEVVRMRVSISELIHQIDYWMKNLPELLKYEFESQYYGMKQVELEAYEKKTTTEICERLESFLCCTALPSHELSPIMFGLWEIKKREDPIDEFIKDIEHYEKYPANLTLSNIKEKWEAKRRK